LLALVRDRKPQLVVVDIRMPPTHTTEGLDAVEVATYYVVAEALTNAAKHAQASHVNVSAVADDDELHLVISDDGIGGAVTGAGSGLIGLKDRVAALAGRLDILQSGRERDDVERCHPAPGRIILLHYRFQRCPPW